MVELREIILIAMTYLTIKILILSHLIHLKNTFGYVGTAIK